MTYKGQKCFRKKYTSDLKKSGYTSPSLLYTFGILTPSKTTIWTLDLSSRHLARRGRRGVEDLTRKPYRRRVICWHCCCCCWCWCHCCCWSTASSPGFSVAWLTLSHQLPQKGRTKTFEKKKKIDLHVVMSAINFMSISLLQFVFANRS